MAATRTETDSMGTIEVPADRYWGAQTQRSIHYLSIGEDRMPMEMIMALVEVKRAAAMANGELGVLSPEIRDLIIGAADRILAGGEEAHFPLRVWMTGSGTQSNMNVNEVIANMAAEAVGKPLGQKDPVHPNDHVNASQSSNDVFPTAMHVATARLIRDRVLPAGRHLRDHLRQKADAWSEIVKIGRTHMQDAVPMTLGQEVGGYATMVDESLRRVELAQLELMPVCLGGTAIGTGLNAPRGFAEKAIAELAGLTGLPLTPVRDRFAAQGAHDALVNMSGALKVLAVSLYKIANDIRFLSCGPRTGLAEIDLPANEPGSSIMPGKVNPTQCEALSMVAAQVMGNDYTVTLAASGGMMELSVSKPVMIHNLCQSAKILADSMHTFTEFCVKGMEPNTGRITKLMESSLMLVTALSPKIGYDRAAEVAHYAHEKDLSLREAVRELGVMSEDEFEKAIDPLKMARPHG